MDFITRFKKLFLPESIPDHLDLKDTEFFKRLLLVLPNQARIEFDRAEPELWVELLRHWSHRENPEQYEADYYLLEPAFVATLSNLVDATPQTLESCHHMSATDENGEVLFSSIDNFCLTSFREDVAKSLATPN